MSIEVSSSLHPSNLSFHPAPAHAAEPPPPAAPKVELQATVSQMNTISQVMNHRLTYRLDQDTNDVIVKVIDADTDEVIKELPAVELQKLHKSIKDAVGLLINELI